MDLATVLSTAPSFGVGGILFGLVIYLLRASHTERGEYRTALADEESRNATQLEAERAISKELRELLDKERNRRFMVEDELSRARAGFYLETNGPAAVWSNQNDEPSAGR